MSAIRTASTIHCKRNEAKFTDFREYELLANFIHPYYCVPFNNYNFLVLKSCQNTIETKRSEDKDIFQKAWSPKSWDFEFPTNSSCTCCFLDVCVARRGRSCLNPQIKNLFILSVRISSYGMHAGGLESTKDA